MPALPATIDTLIIGAGAAGLAAARHLQSAGQAVLVLEAAGPEEARQALETLPLVQAGLIEFQILPLIPYDGFARLFAGEE